MARDLIKTIAENQRLEVLLGLREAAGYELNEGVIETLLELNGHKVTRTQVTALTRFLEEADLVKTEEIGSGVRVVVLTQQGEDVAVGKARCPGVKRPRPEY